VSRSSCGAQGILDRTAADLRTWQAERAVQAAEVVAAALGSGAGTADLRVEIAMDGVTAPMAGRWQQTQVATILGRRLAVPAEAPTRGAVLARYDVGVLGPADALAIRLTQVRRAARGERLPLGAIRGDGAPWMWNAAAAHVPGVRQPRDDDHRSAPLDPFAQLLYPHNPAGAKIWVEQHMGALLTDRVGDVRRALKRLRPWKKAMRDALAQLLGDVARNRTRSRSQEPWHRGLAVGSGAVEGACTHVMHSRFKRAGMRWKQPGVHNVLALRLAGRNGPVQAFWASRGLVVQASG
jgi:hypothetical protein